MAESSEHISCQEVVELVTDYLEAALPAGETSLFELHLNFCEGCAGYIQHMRLTIATVGRVRVEEVPADTRERLMAAFRDWKRS